MSKKFRKIRILWCGEASFLNTGYAVYAKEVLTRLYNTGKYKIAELGCYASHDNPKINDCPWRFYPTLPVNDEEAGAYNANQSYQFGEWRFEDVCLDFRPDAVIDIRDWWMMEYQQRSAFRKFYKWVIMPTVDSSPQQGQYLDTYMDADAVFTYSEFGKDILEKETDNKISVIDTPSPGANFDLLKPVTNKEHHRKSFNFMDNVNIVGTVMRNQRRKLYPNLIAAFRKLLDKNPSLQKNTFLYMHTAHPDLGWDLPYFIRKYNMGNHVLITYKCRDCHSFFPSFYHGVETFCSKCGGGNCTMPSTAFGVTTEELSCIMNWFDLYVQYSICEGFGMPQVEAAACGVPVLTVNYSAMKSVGEKLKAEFVQPKAFFWDSPTQSERAIPDDEELIEKIERFLKLPKSVRSKKGMDAYISVKKHYTWEKAARLWEKYLDSIEPLSHELTWDSKPSIHEPTNEIPQNFNNEEFVRWAVTHIWGEPNKTNGYISTRLLKDLDCGKTLNFGDTLYYNDYSYASAQQTYAPFTTQDAASKLKNMCDYKNYWEKNRYELSINPETAIRPYFLSKVKPDIKYSNTAD